MPAPKQPRQFASLRWKIFRQVEFLLLASGGKMLQQHPRAKHRIARVKVFPGRELTEVISAGCELGPADPLGIQRIAQTDIVLLHGTLVRPKSNFTHYIGLNSDHGRTGKPKQNPIADAIFQRLIALFPSNDVEVLEE